MSDRDGVGVHLSCHCDVVRQKPVGIGGAFDLRGYVRLDLNAANDMGDGHKLRRSIDNVTDEEIFTTGVFSQIYPQAPRTARLTLSEAW